MQKAETRIATCHHVSVLTGEHDRLVQFLTDVLEFTVCYSLDVPSDQLAKLLGWSPRTSTVRSTLLGGGDAGLVEIVDAVEVLKTRYDETLRPSAGPFQLCLMITDLGAILERARAAGADATVGPVELKIGGSTILAGSTTVAGTRFQLTQAGPGKAA